RTRIRESIEQIGANDAGQTNAFYFVFWEEGKAVLARSPGAPENIPLPGRAQKTGVQSTPVRDAPGEPSPLISISRTRGQFCERRYRLFFRKRKPLFLASEARANIAKHWRRANGRPNACAN